MNFTAWKVSKYVAFSGPCFSAFGRNISYLCVFSAIAGKYGPEKTTYLNTFHIVLSFVFPNLQKTVRNLKSRSIILKTYIYVIRRLRVKVKVKILQKNWKKGSFMTFWLFVRSRIKTISLGSVFSIRFNFILV